MNELRLFAHRDSLLEGSGCAWVLLNEAGQVQRSGSSLDDLPAAGRCRLVLAADMVLMVKADLPDLPARKLTPMLPAAAEAATLDEAEQLHVVMLGDKTDPACRLAVVKKAWLERVLGQLRARGLHPEQAIPEHLLLPWAEHEWSILVHEEGAVIRFERHDGAALDQGNPPAGARLAQAQGARPRLIRVYQGSALKAPEVDHWAGLLDTPVEFAGRWDWREAPWHNKDNLLTGPFSAARGRRDWTALVRPLALGLASLAGIQIVAMTLFWAMQTHEQGRIRAEMRALAEAALPAHAAVVDPAWQVGERLKGLKAAAGSVRPDSPLSLLARLGQAWPQGNGPKPLGLNLERNEISLTLAGIDQVWLEQLQAAGAARQLAIALERGDTGQTLLRIRPAGTGAAQ